MSKKKSNWSEVNIDPQLLSDPAFESLASFTELSDYKVIDGKIHLETPKRKSKSEKRKRTETSDASSDRKVAKRSKKSKGDVAVSAVSTDEATTNEETAEPNIAAAEADAAAQVGNAKKSKKRKNKRKKKVAKTSKETTGKSDAAEQMDTVENVSDSDVKNTESEEADVVDDDVSRNWSGLFVPDAVLDALRQAGFVQPTSIQRLTLPAAISARRDMIIAAETGSGKTLAYGIPLLSNVLRILESRGKSDADATTKAKKPNLNSHKNDCGLLACVITPTRELAVQVKRHLESAAALTPIRIALVVGGLDEHKQLRVLSNRPHVVVATPGRFWALIDDGKSEHLEEARSTLRCLVIDEADRLIEDGHFEELDNIIGHFNADEAAHNERQNFVCSATLTFDPRTNVRNQRRARRSKLAELCDRVGLRSNFKTVNLTPVGVTAVRLTECVAKCVAEDKDVLTVALLRAHVGRTLIFVNSKAALRRLVTLLRLVLVDANGSNRKLLRLAANMEQKARLRSMEVFTSTRDAVLVATDVAARGLDVPDVDYVIHYHVPSSSETYVHRCGRTARCTNEGVSILLVAPSELERYEKITAALDRQGGLPKLELSGADVDRWRAAVRLAESITSRQMAESRKQSDIRWLTSLADAADCELDDQLRNELGVESDDENEGNSDDDGASRKQKKKKRRKMRAQARSAAQSTFTAAKRQLLDLLLAAQSSSKRFKLPR